MGKQRKRLSCLQDETSQYIHSDLHNFKPSEETYLFFGKRGSGKTTIRLAMLKAYAQMNKELAEAGEREHFVIDLCSPGHLTACLKDFQVLLRTRKSCEPSIVRTSHNSLPWYAGDNRLFQGQLGCDVHREVGMCRYGRLHHILCHDTNRTHADR